MKKGKVFGKSQLVLAALIVALGAAVWINMKFSASDTDKTNLDSADYLAGSSNLGQALEVNTAVSTIDSSRKDLSAKREELIKTLTETVETAGDNEEVKKNAVDQLAALTDNISKEANIETVIKAKGISDALVIIADESVTVMVQAEELLQSQTLQIQDAVVSQTGVSLDKIKIITL